MSTPTPTSVLRQRVLDGQTVTPDAWKESKAYEDAQAELANLQRQREEKLAKEQYLNRRVSDLNDAKDQILTIPGRKERILDKLRTDALAVITQFCKDAEDLNSDVTAYGGVFRTEKKQPTEGLPALGYRWSAWERGCSIDNVSVTTVDALREIEHIVAWAIGKHNPNHSPFLALPPEVREELEAL